MSRMKMLPGYVLPIFVILTLALPDLAAAPHRGQVRFGLLPMPGAVVRATRGEKTLRAVTDREGAYSFSDLDDGPWTIEVEMRGFEPVRQDVVAESDSAPAVWELRMLPMNAIKTERAPGFTRAEPALPAPALTYEKTEPSRSAAAPPPDPLSHHTADRLLINGSVNNGASTQFAQSAAFGNNRRKPPSQYNAALSLTGNSSAFDARAFSLTGQNTPKPDYGRSQASITFGGPLEIPFVLHNGPRLSFMYNRTQNRNATLQTVRVPTAEEREGNFSSLPKSIVDPLTGLPFAGNVLPQERISPQALTLLNFYPQPNSDGSGHFNFQAPIVGATHGDTVQAQLSRAVGRNQLTGNVGYQSTRANNPSLFSFVDTTNSTDLTVTMNWSRRFTRRLSASARYQLTRSVSQTTPFFANVTNVSGLAGITGNDQTPVNWGPPALIFSSGIAQLSDAARAFNRNQSSGVSASGAYNRGRHALAFGFDLRKQQFNVLTQQDARGTFTFTGAATGFDFADFLLGIPTASSIAFGNADKYFRQPVYDAFFQDDFRPRSNLTLTAGVRWEYEAPITELYGRLVNLDIAPGFAAAAPILAMNPVGGITGRHFGASLLRADTRGIEPRLAFAWRPSASTMVVRGGYGIYRDTSVYRAIAGEMSQQSPLSKSLSVQNSQADPFTLADGFKGSSGTSATTFAIDRDFRIGYAQNWQLSVQRDLPGALQATVTYLGVKGTHVPRRILPNTYAPGAANPCTSCLLGFVYLSSTGNSNRRAGTIELRRRQRNGLAASVQYTFAKAIDDAGLGSAGIAQDWLHPQSERALSNFDQRHSAAVQVQYTSGMLAGLSTFWNGWKGSILKEWTLTAQMTVGSGSPLTPMILVPAGGTGITGTVRPDRTGEPLYTNTTGGFLNPTAFASPAAGSWGNAGRNSITGPRQFSLDGSLTRTFQLSDRLNLDVGVDATNILNHVTFPDWNTTVNSLQFGSPTRTNAMRTIRPSVRVRF